MPKEKRDLVNADEAHHFHIHAGGSVGNLLELKNAFESISDEQYHFHVAPEKNDFAVWVRDVLQDEPASKLLFGCLKRKTALSRIITVLRRYKLEAYNITLPPLVKKERKTRLLEKTFSLPPASPTFSSEATSQQISSPSPTPPASIPATESLPPLPESHNPQNPETGGQ